MTSTPQQIYLRLFNAGLILFPTFVASVFRGILPLQFAPRALLYAPHSIVPLLFHPVAPAQSVLGPISRLIQAHLIFHLPFSRVWLLCYPLSILIALVRCIFGFVFTRALGWAFPPLFSHWSLYEESSGFGPALLIYFALTQESQAILQSAPPVVRSLLERFFVLKVTVLLLVLEYLPWTYGVAAVCGLGLAVLLHFFAKFGIIPRAMPNYSLLPGSSGSGSSSQGGVQLGDLPIALRDIATIFVLSALSSVLFSLRPAPSVSLPEYSGPGPLLDILILTFPRTDDPTTSASVLQKTVASYEPHLSASSSPLVTLSVFTHSLNHPGFNQTATLYSAQVNAGKMEFWQDHDQETHVGEGVEEGQYLHVAEALRYEIERKAENRRAEWILLSEDDFPLCEYGGRQGWDVVKEVVRVLERDRTKHGDVRSGFVGTGGSGFIIHRTYLPLLIHILRTYASNSTTLRLPDQVVRRPPDVAIQDCLLGKQASLCERRQGASNKPPLVIPSRLVVDHIGGMYTTNRDKAFNADKWRCGWRHPFHGREEVGVVVV